MSNDKIYKMQFAKIYPLLVSKSVKKGRTKAEADEIICWLTGYSQRDLEQILESDVDYASFFNSAPALNQKRTLIKGSVCGVKLEEIDDPLMCEIRYLDKLIDELSKGKSMDKILRK